MMPKLGSPPKSWKQFVNSNCTEVKFSDIQSAAMAFPSFDTTALKQPAINVSSFSALNEFIKGSDLITMQLDLMK